MNQMLERRSGDSEILKRLGFFKGLQAITTRIHATQETDEIIFELAPDICKLFGAERLTIYTVDESGQTMIARVKTGLDSVHRVELPLTENSIAGYVALTRHMLNLRNVYDDEELKAISPTLAFRKDLDESSGFRCRQMLVAPLIDADSGRLHGVLQLINNTAGDEAFAAVFEEGALGLAQTLGVAFEKLRAAPAALRSRYHALIVDGRITKQELEEATRAARKAGTSVEAALIETCQLTLAEIGAAASRFFGVPYESFRADRIRQVDLLRNIKREYVLQNQWIPLEETPEGIVILATDPEHVRASRVAHNVFPKRRLALRVTTRSEFEQTVNQFFEPAFDDASVSDLISDLEDEQESSVADDVTAAADNELVKLVNKIIIDAYRQGASDIHIEPRPGKEKTLIRFRRDGALVPYIKVPASYRNPLVTRIKIMCDLDISERRKPQDGKIRFRKYAPLDIELRVATVPTAGGMEDVVMRLLSHGEPRPIDDVGLTAHNLERLKRTVTKPYGLFFVCGPTGSGKTTTLHSILSYINTPETKIWTAEDPVEITQRGLRQVQVNRKAGLDFATMMRAFLRADPDVIMVGEMRDAETVSVGIEASLTGHLVFSTLHTNSAPESVVRLLDMGMDPFNFADALLGVLAQRLAKRLCQKCKEAYRPDEAEVIRLLDEYCEDMHVTTEFRADPDASRRAIHERWRKEHADGEGRFTLYRPVGCPDCNAGYAGRIGLHELMLGSDTIKQQIQDRARAAQLLATALDEGMRTLRQDGIEKVLAGVTDMVQVRKVCIR